MLDKFNKILDKIDKDFYNKTTTKKFILSVVLLFLFFLFQASISTFIKNNLLIVNSYSFPILNILLVMSSLILVDLLYKKLLKKRYLPSSNEYYIFGVILFILSYYRINSSCLYWDLNILISGKQLSIKFIDLPIFLLSLFFIFNLIRYFFPQKYDFDNTDGSKNNLINDDPIYHLEDDELEYNAVVDKLGKILIEEKHKKAISIGLIGPWGNGKSSVINMVEKGIKESKSFKDDSIIAIHFLPYLNHNDDDIINEFFITLSNELSKYSGKLSNELINYSQKLTDLYKEKNIIKFFENHVTNFKNSSANELYININKLLGEIDKKIIVFIDDLDRLNQTEILQVLKLIRNTANFNNTIFVVAMDKEYIISRLKSSEDILNSKFVDKFFQLEIYLPEIRTQILKEYFELTLIKKLTPDNTSDFSLRIKEAIQNSGNLFEDYITNFRDVKRTVNQIVFDYPFTGGEINFKDFVNFTYFKLKFPQFIKILKEGKADFLETDGTGFYKFKTKPKDKKNSDSNDILNIIKNIELNKNLNLEDYVLYSDEFVKDCVINDNIIDCEDRLLFIKTLAFLFGDENKVVDVDSIKYENNFRMLMEQKIYPSLFKNSEFKEILITTPKDLVASIDNLYHSNKIQQLISRIEYFNSDDEISNKQIILVLLVLFEKREYYKLHEVTLIKLLENFVEQNFEKIESKELFSRWLKDNVFEGHILSNSKKLYIFSNLWHSKNTNKFWLIGEQYIFDSVLKLFKEYITAHKTSIPDFNDYTIYGVYHSIKNIGTLKENIISIFLEYWTKEKKEIMCVHFTEIDPFTKSLFKISDITLELFESKSNFISYIKETSDIQNEGIKEFLDFFELYEIRQADKIVYEFEKSIPMKEKIKDLLKNNPRNNYGFDDISQIFFVTSSYELSSLIFADLEIKKHGSHTLQTLIYDNQYFILSTQNRLLNKSELVEMAKRIYYIAITQDQWEDVGFDKKLLFNKENFIPQSNPENFIKLFSIQPPLK